MMTLISISLGRATLAVEPSIHVTSQRPGLVFADNEPVNVQVEVTDLHRPAKLFYTIRDNNENWQHSGTVTIAASAEKTQLPLELPGRGLYQLHLGLEGTATVADTSIAVVFPSSNPDPASPWGVFFVPPHWYGSNGAEAARDQARTLRSLGVAWARLNLYAQDFKNVEITNSGGQEIVKADFSRFIANAKALHAEGISVMGGIWQIPRELSSRPEDASKAGDAGPLYCRVRPRDYKLWDQLIEDVAKALADDISVWEVGNEPNLTNMYWVGTPQELLEKIQHTSRAIKRGNPEARVAGGGFVGGFDDVDRLLGSGLGKDLDILSVHYTNDKPDGELWQRLLRKNRLQIPIWTTEEKAPIPLMNLRGGIARSFKFLSVDVSYSDQQLLHKDLTPLPAGIEFSVGAHCIGTATYAGRTDAVPGFTTTYFHRGSETIAAFQRTATTSKTAPVVTFAVEPTNKALELTDLSGHSQSIPVIDGKTKISLNQNLVFVNGASKLQLVFIDKYSPELPRVFEAESGHFSSKWKVRDEAQFLGGKVLELWEQDEPDGKGYWCEVELQVPVSGDYDILFSGSAPFRLNSARSISPFVWSIDGGKPQPYSPDLTRMDIIPNIGEGLYRLQTMTLSAGEHIFRLKVTDRRETPDTSYTLWFDGLVLRRK